MQLEPEMGKLYDEAYAPKGLENMYYIALLGVSPAAQGKGIGGALVRHLMARAKEAGTEAAVSTHNEKNVSPLDTVTGHGKVPISAEMCSGRTTRSSDFRCCGLACSMSMGTTSGYRSGACRCQSTRHDLIQHRHAVLLASSQAGMRELAATPTSQLANIAL